MYHIIYYLHVLDYMSVWITNSISVKVCPETVIARAIFGAIWG